MIHSVLFLNPSFRCACLVSCGLFLYSPASNANMYSDSPEDFSFHVKSGYAVGKDDQSSMTLLTAGAAYDFSPNFQVNTAISSFMSDNSSVSNSVAGEIYVSWKQALSEDFSIYADLGARSEGGNLLAGAGVRHHLSPDWSAELGYRYYNQPNNTQQGDVYSMLLGLSYTFTKPKKSPMISNDVYSEARPVNIKAKVKQCGGDHLRTYKVVKDDYFYKIARELGLSATELIDLNRCVFDDVNLIYPGNTIYLPIITKP